MTGLPDSISPARDELTVETLMKELGQVVSHEFLEHVAQMPLAEEDEVIQTLVLDRLHEPLRVRIAVGALRGDLHALHAPRP